jgi:hypothetical protein
MVLDLEDKITLPDARASLVYLLGEYTESLKNTEVVIKKYISKYNKRAIAYSFTMISFLKCSEYTEMVA